MGSKFQKPVCGLFLIGLIALETQAADEGVLALLKLEPWVQSGMSAAELSSQLASKEKYEIDETTRYIAFRRTKKIGLLSKKWNQAYILHPKESGLSRVSYDRKSGPESAMDNWTGDDDGAQIDQRYIDQCEQEFKSYIAILISTLEKKPSEQNHYDDSLEYTWTLDNGIQILADHRCASGPLLQRISIELPKP